MTQSGGDAVSIKSEPRFSHRQEARFDLFEAPRDRPLDDASNALVVHASHLGYIPRTHQDREAPLSAAVCDFHGFDIDGNYLQTRKRFGFPALDPNGLVIRLPRNAKGGLGRPLDGNNMALGVGIYTLDTIVSAPGYQEWAESLFVQPVNNTYVPPSDPSSSDIAAFGRSAIPTSSMVTGNSSTTTEAYNQQEVEDKVDQLFKELMEGIKKSSDDSAEMLRNFSHLKKTVEEKWGASSTRH